MGHAEAVAALERLLGARVAGVQKIGSGGNSRVYRVDAASGVFAAKFYFQRTADGRDRLAMEYGALEFLWRNGLRCIPRPIAADRAQQIAVYQYIEGAERAAEAVRPDDIDALTDFLAELRRLAASGTATGLPDAAEAAFTVAGVAANIHRRLDLLRAAGGDEAAYAGLGRFLSRDFEPALERWSQQARELLGATAWDEPIAAASRTLSPSDFGFHNALIRPDGSVVFVDFEYFGWDDPAKMISDFAWHPRSTMAPALKHRFVGRMRTAFAGVAGLDARLEAVFPLFGLKWCMILLNEFRPENLARRRYASGSAQETEAVLQQQLAKAGNTLLRVNQGPRTFLETTSA